MLILLVTLLFPIFISLLYLYVQYQLSNYSQTPVVEEVATHPIDEEVEGANHLLLPENEEVDFDFDIQERVDEEQVEEQPAPLRHERLPTILEEPEEEEEEQVEQQPTPLLRERLPTILEEPEEEEEEQVEQQPSPAVRRRGHKRVVASLLTDLGEYWKSPPSPCGRMRSSRDRRAPQRYVP